MPSITCTRPWLAAIVVLLLGGCTSDVPVLTTQAGLACVDDSPHCIGQRQAALKTLTADPKRSWINERPDAAAYASGVRLFAFKTMKKDLSCTDLEVGRREADQAPSVLRASGNVLTPAQISRGVILASEVGRELGKELRRRCRKS